MAIYFVRSRRIRKAGDKSRSGRNILYDGLFRVGRNGFLFVWDNHVLFEILLDAILLAIELEFAAEYTFKLTFWYELLRRKGIQISAL